MERLAINPPPIGCSGVLEYQKGRAKYIKNDKSGGGSRTWAGEGRYTERCGKEKPITRFASIAELYFEYY